MHRRVLVVEDNEINRDFLRQILEEDYEVLEAENGINALNMLIENKDTISAVILDLVMPQMDGFEFLKKQRLNPDINQIPVIVATKVEDKETEQKALKAGAIDYVTKPYYPDIIKNRLINTIHLREQAAIVNAIQTDALTGLYSRAVFFEHVEILMHTKEAGYYVMESFDIEKFQVINDQYGTEKGDSVLRQVGRILLNCFTPLDGIVSRISADHFAIFYPQKFMHSGQTDQMLHKASVLDGSILPLTFAIGRFLVDDITLEPVSMYDRAVMAMESVKGRFDQHVAVYREDMRKLILEEQQIVNSMKQALENGEFEVWYQPQFNHMTGALIGAEALARWRHPEKGLIMPDQFISLFEKNGFIYELDKYVWEKTCCFLHEAISKKMEIIPISVNVSRYDIFQPDMVIFMSDLILKYDIPIDMFRLEITESAFATSGEQIIRIVNELRETGFVIEIDDFGSGYSSLNILKNVPVGVIKLDMGFLKGEGNSERGGNILESIVRMAKWIGMSVIAEGVETLQQADFLKSVGCYYVQGFLYSRAVPQSEFERILTDTDYVERMATMETVETYDNEAFWNPDSVETLIFNSFIGGACVFEYVDGKIEVIRANDKYVRILSGGWLNSKDAIHLDWEQYLTPAAREKTQKAMKAAIETGGEIVDELELVGFREPCQSVFFRATMRVIASTGNRYLFYCVLEDITNEYKEDAQRKELLENLPCGAGLFDISNGMIRGIYINRKYWKLVGREPVQTELFPVLDSIKLEDRACLPIAIQRIIVSGKEQECEIHVKHGDGGYLPFLVRGNAVKHHSGRMTLYVTYTVITEDEFTFRQMLPVAMEKIMSATSDYSFIKDRALNYVCASYAFSQMAGLDHEKEVIGKTDYDLFEKNIAEKFKKADQKLLKGGKDQIDYYDKIQSKNGTVRYFKFSKYILRDATGVIIGLYGLGKDITNDAQEKLFMPKEDDLTGGDI